MPRYNFECKPCEMVFTTPYAMLSVPPSSACVTCGREAKRVFTAPQLVTLPELCSDANKKGIADLNATAKTDEKAYNKRWDRRLQSL
jgi:putative FmdB family regulatory protein